MSVPPSNRPGDFTIRILRGQSDYDACVELQRLTWGANFTELVPPSLQMVTQKMGGVAAGAFDSDGGMVGFVYGMTGVHNGRVAHWSHMLAVRERVQGLGLGRQLKQFQRELLLEMDIDLIYWTYDPLVARNAHLNLNRLGASPIEYVRDMYGGATDSDLHSGLGTDRFVVEWQTCGELATARARGDRLPNIGRYDTLPAVNANAEEGPLSRADSVRVEIPSDIMATKHESADVAWQWRLTTRRALMDYLASGYAVEAFYRDGRDGRCYYVVSRVGT